MADVDLDALFEAARAVRARAHAPYSRFRVGAAILGEGGGVHQGCNVENAAYPVGACAEAGAISAMVAAGERRIEAIAVAGAGDAPCFPCGACRQRIREFSSAGTAVLVGVAGGGWRRYTLDDLLPHAFGPDNLALP